MNSTLYFSGGFIASAPNKNIKSIADSATGLYKEWDTQGTLIVSRALTTAEAADLAAGDTAATSLGNATTIRQRAQTALTTNATFLAIASPTAAQVAAQTKALTRECNGLIRLLLGALTDVSDT